MRVMESAAGDGSAASRRAAEMDWRAALAEAGGRLFGVEGLDVVLPGGTLLPSKGRAAATLRLSSHRAARAFLTRDQLGLFEAYLDQQADVEPAPGDDAAAALLAAVKALDEQWADYRWLTAALASSRYFWQQSTKVRRAALAVHYSVPPDFWLAFMSKEHPIYSHYLFEDGEPWQAWETACLRKLEHALRACKLRPGDRVLNVGEGWGGFLTYAGHRGMRVTSVTLNDESYAACLARREREGLAGSCHVVHEDFYALRSDEPFDAITNMGVTEHLTDYDGLMARYSRLLRSGGHVYSDFVGTTRDRPFRSLIQKQVYPGAQAVYLPRLFAAVERNADLDVVAVHDDRLSYDRTCEAWARNVEASRDMLVRKFGEKRYRWLWSYLWMCVHAFRTHENGITGTRVVLRRR